MLYQVNLNKVSICANLVSRTQHCHRCNEFLINGCITTYISSYLNIHPMIDKAFPFVFTTRRFYFAQKFLPILLNQYISNIWNLYNSDVNLSISSQTICDHMFSDPKSYHIIRVFGYEPGLYFVSSHVWQLSTYFEDRKVLEYNVSWFPIEPRQTEQEYKKSLFFNVSILSAYGFNILLFYSVLLNTLKTYQPRKLWYILLKEVPHGFTLACNYHQGINHSSYLLLGLWHFPPLFIVHFLWLSIVLMVNIYISVG